MYRDKKVVVVMPAYNAAKTLPRTYSEVLEQGIVDKIILVDDRSRDNTVEVARSLPGVRRASCTRKTPVTAGTKKPATASRWPPARTSSS